MAIFRLNMEVVSRRPKGSPAGTPARSVVQLAAYISGEELTHGVDGEATTYRRDSHKVHEVVGAWTELPEKAASWMDDRELVWNRIEQLEGRKDAQLARHVTISIPRELSHEQQQDLVARFARTEFAERGFVVDIGHHENRASDGGLNPHAHLLVGFRRVVGEDFDFKKARDLNNKNFLEHLRKSWETMANEALEDANRPERISHLSLAAQQEMAKEKGDQLAYWSLNREPTRPMGTSYVRAKECGLLSENLTIRKSNARSTIPPPPRELWPEIYGTRDAGKLWQETRWGVRTPEGEILYPEMPWAGAEGARL